MKVAVVGAGTMGALHAQLLAETEDVETVLVVDVDQGRASEEAARIGGRAASFEEALTEADAVVISTPPQFHEQQVTAAIEAGLHVMCEKPLTDRLDSTLALAERIESEGAHVEVGFQRRHDAGFRRAREGIVGPHPRRAADRARPDRIAAAATFRRPTGDRADLPRLVDP